MLANLSLLLFGADFVPTLCSANHSLGGQDEGAADAGKVSAASSVAALSHVVRSQGIGSLAVSLVASPCRAGGNGVENGTCMLSVVRWLARHRQAMVRSFSCARETHVVADVSSNCLLR